MTETLLNNEPARLKALKSYNILDTPKDGHFDRLTALASKIFNVPISIISLVDHDRIWFKSAYGLDAQEIGKDPGLCASAIISEEIYIVEDAANDPRTLANPLVAGSFGLRFYAAAPLVTRDGYKLGTFCIIDQKQRYITDQQKQILKDLAAIAMDEIEIRLAARMHARQVNQLLNDSVITLKENISEIKKLPHFAQDDKLQHTVQASLQTLQKIDDHLAAQL